MPRTAGVVLPGYPYQVTRRGNRREDVCFSSEDRDVYREWLFYSTVLDEDYLWTAVRYVETNPVRAGLVTQAEAYPWSSARAHCGLAEDPLLSPWRPFPDEEGEWSAWLAAATDDEHAKRLHAGTHTGRTCGNPRFINRLERRLGRPLRPQKRGRRPQDRGEG